MHIEKVDKTKNVFEISMKIFKRYMYAKNLYFLLLPYFKHMKEYTSQISENMFTNKKNSAKTRKDFLRIKIQTLQNFAEFRRFLKVDKTLNLIVSKQRCLFRKNNLAVKHFKNLNGFYSYTRMFSSF